MSRVRLVHWKADGAAALAETLRQAGYQVEYDEELHADAIRFIREQPPDLMVIDLSRLPSRGREVATFFRGRKTTRGIPILFVGGEPEKVEAVRKALPDALYAPAANLVPAVRQALAKRLVNPVVPPQMMERYAARTTSQKLGIEERARVAVIDPPRNYAVAVGTLPPGAVLEEAPGGAYPVTLWFVHDAAGCAEALPAMRKLAARTRLWILWRKGGDVTQQFLRASAADVGLVDYKICSVDKTWSGMLFARRKSG